MEPFKVIIVEDVPLELKGTLGIVKNDIPEAEIIGTAENEPAYWRLVKQQLPDLVLLDLGLGGSTTVGVEICRHTKESYPHVKVLIFTGEILNEKLWVDVLDAGADGIILKSGELLTRGDVASVMDGNQVLVGDAHRELGLADEARTVVGVTLHYLGAHHLQGVFLSVWRLDKIDRPHRTAAYETADRAVAEPVARPEPISTFR